jgi:2-iminobutanoate/2-iminopropanoate deaminase
MNAIRVSQLFSENQLFAQGVQAGEFTFLAQDARGRNGIPGANSSAEVEIRQTLANLDTALKSNGESLDDLVSLFVFLTDYADSIAVADVLRATFKSNQPAVNLVGVCGLEANCRIRVDAIATSSKDRQTIVIPNLPCSHGAGCHAVRVGNFFFLSGVDAADADSQVTPPVTIQLQTTEALHRIERILGEQGLGLRDLCRTFMFIPGTRYRPGYGEARKEIYKDIFREDEFPPNSGIYIRSLGERILLRSTAFAYRGVQTIITSPKVRLAPGSFSQSVRVGDWLLLAGQDAVGFDRVVEAEGSLAGQTEATLRHTKDIVEAAGGSLDDIVKTTVYLTQGADRAEFARAYRKFFEANRRTGALPAGLTVEVQELSPRCFVEIDAVAFLGKG